MKAVVLPAFDESPQLVEIDIPTPDEGEVRVQIHAAAVNGFDLAVAGSMLQGAVEHRFPVVLGKDFAGTIDAVGAGVDGYQIGDRVFGVVTKPFLGDGSFAEYATVAVSVGLAKIPDNVSFTEAAALGLAGTAATDALDAARLDKGSTVLIAGATGGVGTLAVQLAAAAGARVIATAKSQNEIDHVRELGATDTVDYTQDVAGQVLNLVPEGVDAVLHFAGDPQPLTQAIGRGGKLVSTLLQSPEQVQAEGVEVASVYAQPTPETLRRLAANQLAGNATVVIEKVYDLEHATDAFAHFGSGTLGKLVLSVQP